jgi:DNA-binding SARP family transcriptional activator
VGHDRERGLQLLDRFRLVWDGVDVDVPPQSAIVVAYLAISERPIHRSVLAGSLSPALSERRALAALRSALYRIRAPVVVAEGDLLRLAHDVRVDLRESITLARSLLRAGAPPDPIEPIIQELGRELLPNDDGAWVEAERQRFRHLRLSALDALASALTDDGRHAEAVEAAQLAVAIEPASEAAESTLVRALIAEGNAALALREWMAFRARLWRELRVRPTSEFEEVRRGAGHGRAAVTAPRRAGDGSHHPGATHPRRDGHDRVTTP